MIIELNNLKPTYMSEAEISASDIYLQEKVVFEKGNKYLLKAHSGHGKSSVLNFIYGSNVNYDGTISYKNELQKKDLFELRKTNISYVFQDFKLFPTLTVFENILLKNKLTNHKTESEIDALITEVKLGHKRDSLVQNLSLGQRQRVAIIRSLCQPFDFLLLDEPFSHLDIENMKTLTEIMNREISKNNAGLILTTLDDEYLFEYDQIIKL